MLFPGLWQERWPAHASPAITNQILTPAYDENISGHVTTIVSLHFCRVLSCEFYDSNALLGWMFYESACQYWLVLIDFLRSEKHVHGCFAPAEVTGATFRFEPHNNPSLRSTSIASQKQALISSVLPSLRCLPAMALPYLLNPSFREQYPEAVSMASHRGYRQMHPGHSLTPHE